MLAGFHFEGEEIPGLLVVGVVRVVKLQVFLSLFYELDAAQLVRLCILTFDGLRKSEASKVILKLCVTYPKLSFLQISKHFLVSLLLRNHVVGLSIKRIPQFDELWLRAIL